MLTGLTGSGVYGFRDFLGFSGVSGLTEGRGSV